MLVGDSKPRCREVDKGGCENCPEGYYKAQGCDHPELSPHVCGIQTLINGASQNDMNSCVQGRTTNANCKGLTKTGTANPEVNTANRGHYKSTCIACPAGMEPNPVSIYNSNKKFQTPARGGCQYCDYEDDVGGYIYRRIKSGPTATTCRKSASADTYCGGEGFPNKARTKCRTITNVKINPESYYENYDNVPVTWDEANLNGNEKKFSVQICPLRKFSCCFFVGFFVASFGGAPVTFQRVSHTAVPLLPRLRHITLEIRFSTISPFTVHHTHNRLSDDVGARQVCESQRGGYKEQHR
jgi:hypothetical protein